MNDLLYEVLAVANRPLQHPLFLLPFIFVAGGMVGSLLNVCIYRLPLEKSILWPSSRCLKCLKPINALDNLPFIGYLRLKGKCRNCGATFSSRYFWIELLTATAFAATFYYCMTLDEGTTEGGLNPFAQASKGSLFLMWLSQAFFLSFLIVVTFTDIDHREIPLSVTIPGTLFGLLFGMLLPWPVPATFSPPPQAVYGGMAVLDESMLFLPVTAQPWPFWLPAFSSLPPGTWLFGLVNALVGAAVGTGVIRFIRWVFSWGFGKEAMGIGDADLMMMIGAFLGWQATILVLLFAVGFALVYALVIFIANRGQELPFGPFLATGAVLLTWGPNFSFILSQKLFFDGLFLAMITGLAVVLAVVMSFIIRAARLIYRAG